VNKVILIGFLGEAPEVRFSQKGKPVGTFSLAVNERWKDVDGAPRERVEWFQIVCFGRLAEVCGEYLNKGRHIYLEGRLQSRKWAGPEGEKRATIEVVANQMLILDRAPKNGNGAKAAESSKPAEPVDESDNPFNEPGSETTDQVPFCDLPPENCTSVNESAPRV
jgi:single-strand DNA-binding protein